MLFFYLSEVADEKNNTEVHSQVANETSGQETQQNEINQQVKMSTSPHDNTDVIKQDEPVVKQDKPVEPEIGEPLEPGNDSFALPECIYFMQILFFSIVL